MFDANKIWAMQKTSLERMILSYLANPKQYDAMLASQDLNASKPYFVDTNAVRDAEAAASSGYDYIVKKRLSKNGIVALIPIMGVMSRYDSWYSWGSERIASWIMEAAMDKDIGSVVLPTNTGGGDASGIELIAAAVKYCKTQKPVVAHVIHSYSGGVWATCHASEIMIESRTVGGTGSIGAYSSHLDYAELFKKEGIAYELIRAEGSENKALNNSLEPLSEAARANIKAAVTEVRKAFITEVKAGLKGVDESVFDGSEFNGNQALKVGLAHSIGFLGDAIAKADKLAA